MSYQQSGMHSRLERSTFFIMLIVVTLAFGWLMTPFASPIFWAIVFSLIFYPLQERLLHHLGDRKNLSAALTLLAGLIVAVIPILIFFFIISEDVKKLAMHIADNGIDINSYVEQASQHFPQLNHLLDKFGIDESSLKKSAQNFIKKTDAAVAKNTMLFGQSTIIFFTQFGLMLYLAFFLLRDGKRIIAHMLHAFPLSSEYETKLSQKFYQVVQATVKGNIVIAILQGGLGGVFFWILGIPQVLIWTAAMIFTSLIPAIGCTILWGPVALYLLVSGDYIKGVSLIAYGVLVIGLVDNFVRPIIVGKDTKMPDYVILFSTLGGLSLFGVDGFVAGPLLAALFIVLWSILVDEFNTNPSEEQA